MADFYLSAAGNDANDGTFASPWKTLTRLNAAFADGTIGLSSRALLRRGDTFYGKLRPPIALDAGSPGWLKIDAYGDGAKPMLSGYKILNTASAWTAYDANTWQIDFSAGNIGTSYTGYDSAQSAGNSDVGLLRVDGVAYGNKKKSLSELSAQWDFYSTDSVLYVRSSAKPTTLASDIRCTVDGPGVLLGKATEIANLDLAGHGGHGIKTVSGGNRMRAIGNTIRDIGGSTLNGFGDGTVRYGNGIEITITGGTTDFHGERNVIHDCYDCAFTIQTGVVGTHNTAADVMWRRNLTYRCMQAEEYFYDGTGVGLDNCVSEYNTNLFCGYGFGADSRPAAPFLRVALFTTNWGDGNTVPQDLTLRRNIYFDAGAAFALNVSPTPGLVSDRNVILLRPGTKMEWSASQTVENASVWAANTGRERKSMVKALPGGGSSTISDAAVTSAIADLDALAPTGQRLGDRSIPIHAPWRAAA